MQASGQQARLLRNKPYSSRGRFGLNTGNTTRVTYMKKDGVSTVAQCWGITGLRKTSEMGALKGNSAWSRMPQKLWKEH